MLAFQKAQLSVLSPLGQKSSFSAGLKAAVTDSVTPGVRASDSWSDESGIQHSQDQREGAAEETPGLSLTPKGRISGLQIVMLTVAAGGKPIQVKCFIFIPGTAPVSICKFVIKTSDFSEQLAFTSQFLSSLSPPSLSHTHIYKYMSDVYIYKDIYIHTYVYLH